MLKNDHLSTFKYMSYSPEEIGTMLFGPQAPTSQIGIEGGDNEIMFEILLNILKVGLVAKNYSFIDLLQEEKCNEINNRLKFCRYEVKVENISPSDASDVQIPTPFCKVRDVNDTFTLCRYHPFRLLELMDSNDVPHAFIDLFSNRNKLPSIVAQCENIRIMFNYVSI
jgi:hypothetical protein